LRAEKIRSQKNTVLSHPTASPKGLLSGGLTRLPRWFYGVPELDFHLQADDDLSGHTTLCWAAFVFSVLHGYQNAFHQWAFFRDGSFLVISHARVH
jgi:hypothetical protein